MIIIGHSIWDNSQETGNNQSPIFTHLQVYQYGLPKPSENRDCLKWRLIGILLNS